jgi:UDP-glucose:(heptosyl)LPS alpha-1,3-glucosyltransferase
MDPSRGGRETSTAQVASALARRGHAVEILCQRSSWQAEGVAVKSLGSEGLLPLTRLKNFVAAVGQTVGGNRYDIVHGTLPLPGVNVYQPRGGTVPGQRAAKIRKHRLLGPLSEAITGQLNYRRRLMAELERQVVGDRAVLCLAVSRMIADELERHYGRTDRVRVVYNAVDVPDPAGEQRAHHRQRIRYSLGLARNDTVFITVARNFGLKGVAECIAAFSKWHHGHQGRLESRLVVVGGDNPEAYQRYAGLREVGRQVIFVPPTQDIFDWYAAADVCLLLSWYDPCSRVVLEATRWGIPSITTAYNGAAEALAGGAGIVVNSPRNIKAVVAAMDELSDPEKRAAYCTACMQAAGQLTIEGHVDELLKAYAEAARRP